MVKSKVLLLFLFVAGVMLSSVFLAYSVWFSLDYSSFLNLVFFFEYSTSLLLKVLMFMFLFILFSVILFSLYPSLEAEERKLSYLLFPVLSFVLFLVIVGHTKVLILTGFLLSLSIFYAMYIVNKWIGVFKIRKIVWRASQTFFFMVAVALMLSFLSALYFDYDTNYNLTKGYFLSYIGSGLNSSVNVLREQMRATYQAGFISGAIYMANRVGVVYDADAKEAVESEAEAQAKLVLPENQSDIFLEEYAKTYPLFGFLMDIFPWVIAATIFLSVWVVLKYLVRPIVTVIAVPLYDYFVRMYIELQW